MIACRGSRRSCQKDQVPSRLDSQGTQPLPQSPLEPIPHHCLAHALANNESAAVVRQVPRQGAQDQQLVDPGATLSIDANKVLACLQPFPLLHMATAYGGRPHLDSETPAPLEPSALDYVTTAAVAHASAEAVFALARDSFRLIGPLGHNSLRCLRLPPLYFRARGGSIEPAWRRAGSSTSLGWPGAWGGRRHHRESGTPHSSRAPPLQRYGSR